MRADAVGPDESSSSDCLLNKQTDSEEGQSSSDQAAPARQPKSEASEIDPASSIDGLVNDGLGTPEHASPSPEQPKKSGVLVRAFAGVATAIVAVVLFAGPKVAEVAGGIMGAAAVKVAVPMLSQNSDAQKVATIWPKMEADPTFGPYFRELKSGFPEEYAELQEVMTEQLLHGKRDQDRAVSFAFMERFSLKNGSHVAAASDSALIELADAQLRLSRELKKSDVSICAQYGATGRLGPEYSPNEGIKFAAASLTAKTLRAIASGKRSPTYRPDPTSEEASIFWEALGAQVGDQNIMEAFGADTVSNLSLDQQCDLGVGVFEALASLPKAERAYWMATIAKESFQLLQASN